ncbi:effector-associated constant component EACC1 [Kutzneria chonburiensis]|uniref:effector-associated constant component EACC1 n=1 Tax=Kutzneria chonburiensis TaxID=1483604 RepID=UPI00235DFD28|nr:hypothetical protein [Kutzneria chonburiensis]
MQARIQVDQPDELRSLHQWLQQEDELRGQVTLENAPPVPGEMGTLADALVVAVGSGGAITVLANSITVWLRQRKSAVTVKLTENGRTVEVTVDRAADAEAIIRSALGDQGRLVDHNRDSRADAAPGGTAGTPEYTRYEGVPAAPPGTTSIPTLIDHDPRDTP